MTEAAEDNRGNKDTLEIDHAAFRKAHYASLANRAYTEQAKQLVDNVFELMMQASSAKRAPYEATQHQMRRGIEGLLGHLLQAAGHEDAKGYVYRSLHGDSFTKGNIGRTASSR